MQSTLETRTTAQKVLDYIAEHPDQHAQETWFSPEAGFYDSLERDGIEYHSPEAAERLNGTICNTSMCAAGTAMFVTFGTEALVNPGKFVPENGAYFEGGKMLLGLEIEEATWLFYDTGNSEAVNGLRAIANGDSAKLHELMDDTYQIAYAPDEDF